MNKATAEKIIGYAIKAPSGHNTQPWKFAVDDDRIEIHPDYSRSLPIVDPDNRELFISLGAATENLVLAAQAFGFSCKVIPFPRDEDYINIILRKTDHADDTWLKPIDKRQSNRSKYSEDPLTKEDLAKLKAVQPTPTVYGDFITRSSDMLSVVALIEEGNKDQMSNPAFKKELLAWIRFNKHEAHKKGDGLSNAAMGNPGLPFRWLGQLIVKPMLTPEKQNKRDEPLLQSASGFLILSTDAKNKTAWVNAGRYFEHIALVAAKLDIAISHYNQPIEVPRLAGKLKTQLALRGNYPCLMVRFGYARPMPYSSRRPISAVIVPNGGRGGT